MSENPNTPSQEAARYQQTQERDDQRRRLREEATIEKTFLECPAKFKLAPGEVLKFLGGSVHFDADGAPSVNGVPLSEALLRYSRVNAHAVAQTPDETFDKGQSSVKSRADLHSTREKVDFIAAHGATAFARLPAVAQEPSPDVPSDYASYLKLPLSQRAKLAAEKGAAWIAGLQRRAQEQTRYDKLVGTPQGKRR